MKNFHIPLEASLYKVLRAAAAQAGRPATKFAQELLHEGLAAYQRRQRTHDIAAYAAAVAGSEDDLDEALQATGLDALGLDE